MGVTISVAQAALARERVATAGLEHLVEIRVPDYRQTDDSPFGAISSIGMAERVGGPRCRAYADIFHQLPAPCGRLLDHQMSRRPVRDEEKYRTDPFIDRYVFPDGHVAPVGSTVSLLEVGVGPDPEGRRDPWGPDRLRLRAAHRPAVARLDRKAYIWDTGTGQQRAQIEHGDFVLGVFSPDGRTVATRGQDHTAQVSDAETWAPLFRVEHQGGPRAVAFSPDSSMLATGSEDGAVCVWRADSGQSPLALKYSRSVNAAAFSPDGRFLVSAGEDKVVHSVRVPEVDR